MTGDPGRLSGMKKLLCLAMLAACGGGGDSSGGGGADGGGGSGSGSGSNTTPLACSDFAYCSTYKVSVYEGTVGTPAGGTIADGTYRLAWDIAPVDSGYGDSENAYAIYFANGQFVYGDYGERGNVAIDGTALNFDGLAHCSEGTESTGTRQFSYEFTATGNELHLFGEVSTSSTTFTVEHVLLRVDDVCETVDSAPSSPGDSYRCNVINCACNAAQGSPVDSCT